VSLPISSLLTEEWGIHGPESLIAITKDLKENFVDKGLLVIIESSCSMEQVIAGKFPDLVIFYFETADDRTRYELFCDTYHGGPGKFGLADPRVPFPGDEISKGSWPRRLRKFLRL